MVRLQVLNCSEYLKKLLEVLIGYKWKEVNFGVNISEILAMHWIKLPTNTNCSGKTMGGDRSTSPVVSEASG